jgi:hypothetical protein
MNEELAHEVEFGIAKVADAFERSGRADLAERFGVARESPAVQMVATLPNPADRGTRVIRRLDGKLGTLREITEEH